MMTQAKFATICEAFVTICLHWWHKQNWSQFVKLLLAPTGLFLFQIFIQSIDAIDVKSVTLSRLNSINAIDVTTTELFKGLKRIQNGLKCLIDILLYKIECWSCDDQGQVRYARLFKSSTTGRSPQVSAHHWLPENQVLIRCTTSPAGARIKLCLAKMHQRSTQRCTRGQRSSLTHCSSVRLICCTISWIECCHASQAWLTWWWLTPPCSHSTLAAGQSRRTWSSS